MISKFKHIIPDGIKNILRKKMAWTKKVVYLVKNSSVYFGKRVQVLGMEKTSIGANTCISDDCWFNVNQRSGSNKTLIIGKNSFVGRRNFFTVGREIVIGDYFFSSIDCSFIGSTHRYNEYVPYILGDTDAENSIKIGCNVFIGAHSKIIGDVTIGYGSIVGANTTILHNIPPLSMVVGSQGRIVKRYNMETKEWDIPKNVNNKMYITEQEYLNKLVEKYPRIPKIKHAASTREGWL
jgi:acetyltransferase-like isoleucine patch superfamily enzyme